MAARGVRDSLAASERQAATVIPASTRATVFDVDAAPARRAA